MVRGVYNPLVFDMSHPSETTLENMTQQLKVTVRDLLDPYVEDIPHAAARSHLSLRVAVRGTLDLYRDSKSGVSFSEDADDSDTMEDSDDSDDSENLGGSETSNKLRNPEYLQQKYGIDTVPKQGQILRKGKQFVCVTLPADATSVSTLALSTYSELENIIATGQLKNALETQNDHTDAAGSQDHLSLLHIHPNIKCLHFNMPANLKAVPFPDSGIDMLTLSSSSLRSTLTSLSLSGEHLPIGFRQGDKRQISPLGKILEFGHLKHLRLSRFNTLVYEEDNQSRGARRPRRKYMDMAGNVEHGLKHLELHDCKMARRVLEDLISSIEKLSTFVWNVSGPTSVPEVFVVRRILVDRQRNFKDLGANPTVRLHFSPEYDAEADRADKKEQQKFEFEEDRQAALTAAADRARQRATLARDKSIAERTM